MQKRSVMSDISLIYYRVNELEFKFNEEVNTNISFQIKPKIECKATKKNDNLFVNLVLKINEDISSPVPFNLKVRLTGTFKVPAGPVPSEAGQRAQIQETFSVLYPYLRAIVSEITLACNIPAYILPSVTAMQPADAEIADEIKKGGEIN